MALNDGNGMRPSVNKPDSGFEQDENASAFHAGADSEMQRLAQVDVPTPSTLPAPPEIEFKRPALSRTALNRAFPGSDKNLFGSAPSGGSGGGNLNDRAGQPSHLGAGLIIGVTFPACIVVGASIGVWIDHHWLHTATPWATIGMTLVGIAAGLINVYRALDMIGVAKVKSGNK